MAAIEDHVVWSEYGMPLDHRRLPGPHRNAHLAILEGQRRRRAEEDDVEQDVEQLQRQAGRW